MKKKVLSILLALVMVFSLIPTTMWAEEGNVAKIGDTEYATLAAAIAAAQDGAETTITMIADETLISTLTISEDLTLDLNGQTLTMNVTSGTTGAVYVNGHSLTVQDSSDGQTGRIDITSNSGNGAYGFYLSGSGSNLSIEGGNITATNYYNSNSSYFNQKGIQAVTVSSGTSFTMSGGSLTASNANNSGKAAYAVYVTGGTANVTGGSIIVDDHDVYGWSEDHLVYKSSGTVSITGGKFKSPKQIDFDGIISKLPSGYTLAAADADGYRAVVPAVNYVAQIGNVKYESLEAAVEAAVAGDTIVLLGDVTYGADKVVAVWEKDFNLDLNGYTFTTNSTQSSYKAAGICFGDYATTNDPRTISVSNGTVRTAFGAGIYVDGAVTMTLSSLDVKQDYPANVQSTPEYSSAVRLTSKATVIIEDGSYEGKNAIAVSNSGGNVTVNGGDFTGDIFFSANTDAGVTKTITINGGNFNGGFVNANKGTLVITGGTFTTDPTAYVAPGYEAVDNNGTWTVSSIKVAQIGSVKYETLEAAIAAAQDGDTVELLADIDLSNHARSASDDIILNGVTLDLNNKTIRGYNSGVRYSGENAVIKNGTFDFVDAEAKKNYALSIGSYSNDYLTRSTILLEDLTVNGGVNVDCADVTLRNVNIDAQDNSYYCLWVDEDHATATYESGIINANNVQTAVFGAAKVQAAKVTENVYSGTLLVTGGTVNTNGRAFVLATGVHIFVSGGTFDIEVPAADIAEGYEAVDNNNGTWTVSSIKVAQIGSVKYETLEAAIAAAQDGEIVTVLADCSGNGIKVPQGKFTTGLTVNFNGHTYTMDGAMVGSTGTETQAFQLLKDNKITFQNGTITSTKAKILVQNYSNLTLEGMTLTLDNPNYTSAYTLSNNNGEIVIDNTTINANPAGGFAFDVCRYASYPSVHVTVQGTSVINGNVEISASGSDAKDGFDLTLTSGTLNGNIVLDGSAATAMEATPEKATVTKADAFTQTAPAGYKWSDNGNGTSSLVKINYVAQIGNTKYETLADAIAAVPTDGGETTITMIADEELANGVTVVAGKNIVLDLNGFTVSESLSQSGTTALITNRGTLTIKDSTDTNADGTGTGKITYFNSLPDPAAIPGYASNTIINNGTLTIESGLIENRTNGGYAAYTVDNITNGTSYTPVFTMNGGRLYNNYTDAVRMFLNSVSKLNKVVINGGVLDSDKASGRVIVVHNPNSKVNKGELDITGGIINGKINAWSAANAGGVEDRFSDAQYAEISINISGGKIRELSFTEMADETLRAQALQVTGGKYVVDPSAYVTEGYEAVTNTDDDAASYPLVVTEAAPVDVYTAAAAAATGTLSVGGTGGTFRFTITKNGTKLTKTAEYSAEKDNWELVYDPAYIELTKTAASSTGIAYTVKALQAGTTTITFRNKADHTITASTVLTNKHAVSITYDRSTDDSGNKYLLEKGTLTITKITFDGVAYTGADLDTFLASHTLTVEGNATIDGLNVTPNATGNVYIHVTDNEDATVTARSGLLNFINAAARIGNDYYATLAKAFKAAQNGDTITLISDTTEYVDFSGTAPRATEFALTLDLNGHTFTAPANENFALRVEYGVITIKDSVGTGAIRHGKNSAILVDHLAGNYPSKVIIESGTFTGKSTVVQTGYPGGSGANYKYYGGELEVLGGTFVTVADTDENYDANGNFRYTLNMLDMVESNYAGGIYSESSITVKGGIFNKFDPSNNLAEGANTNFVAPGYEAVEVTSGTWQVGEIKASAIAAQETVTENYHATYTASKKVVDENNETLAEDTSITVNLKADDNEVSTGNVLNDQYDVSTIVAAIVEAEGAKASTLNVSITVVKDNPQVVEENNKKTVTYEVHPVATITNETGDTLGTYTISNDQLAGGATFVIKLPVPEALRTSGYVKVTHKLSDGSTVVYGSLAYDDEGFITIADVAEFSEFELEIAETVTESASYGFTLALKNKIEIPLYVYNLSYPADNYYVEYSYTNAEGNAVHNIVCLTENADYSVGNGWYRVVVAEFSARQMNDEVHVRLYNNYTNEVIYDNNYSIKQYCEYMIGGGTQTQSLIKLCKAALDYGKAAQLYFGYNTSSQIADSYYFLNSDVTIESKHASSLHSNQLFSFVGATVSLKSQVQVNFYFQGGYGDYTFEVNGEVVSPEERGGYYVVSSSGITAKDLGKPVTVTVTSHGVEETFSYSPLAYAYSVQEYSQNNELIDVCKAMYLYWSAANDYLMN